MSIVQSVVEFLIKDIVTPAALLSLFGYFVKKYLERSQERVLKEVQHKLDVGLARISANAMSVATLRIDAYATAYRLFSRALRQIRDAVDPVRMVTLVDGKIGNLAQAQRDESNKKLDSAIDMHSKFYNYIHEKRPFFTSDVYKSLSTATGMLLEIMRMKRDELLPGIQASRPEYSWDKYEKQAEDLLKEVNEAVQTLLLKLDDPESENGSPPSGKKPGKAGVKAA